MNFFILSFIVSCFINYPHKQFFRYSFVFFRLRDFQFLMIIVMISLIKTKNISLSTFSNIPTNAGVKSWNFFHDQNTTWLNTNKPTYDWYSSFAMVSFNESMNNEFITLSINVVVINLIILVGNRNSFRIQTIYVHKNRVSGRKST